MIRDALARTLSLTLVGIVAALVSSPAVAQLPPGFVESIVIGGLDGPTVLRFSPDGRVFVAEKSGAIRVFDSLSDPTATMFADLSNRVHDYWDRGLLGFALHPDFPATPYVYVLYTVDAPIGGTPPVYGDGCSDGPGGACVVSGRLSRLTASGNTWTGVETVLIWDWCQKFPSHSIGDIHFGLDGALYVTGGDGADFNSIDEGEAPNECGDPPLQGGALRSQDLRTPGDPVSLDGTLLRLDPLTGAAMPGNPLLGGDPGDDRIVAYGLRNPFRFAVHPFTNEIWICDTGWNLWEEINRVPDPADAIVENFGWPCYEGAFRQPGYDNVELPICESIYTTPNVVTPPFYAYSHSEHVVPGDNCSENGSSPSGAVFYTASNYPQTYDGALFFCDYSRECIWAILADANGVPDPAQRITLRRGAPGPVMLTVGPDGNLYYVSINTGTIRRIEYFAVNTPPIAAFSASPNNGPSPLTVNFDAAASSDPDGDLPLSFAWDLDGDGQYDDSTAVAPTYQYNTSGTRLVSLRVTDAADAEDTETAAISVDNAPPIVTIDGPSPATLWRVGDLLNFSGHAVDPDSGPLPVANLSWHVILHHCHHDEPSNCHAHPLQTIPGVAAGSIAAPNHEYPAHLEFRLTATDNGPVDWWNTNLTRRTRLSFNAASIPENLASFPVLVKLDATRIDYTQTQNAGQDLRFVDADGTTALPYEIERWDESGTSYVWVRVPQVAGGSNADFFWMYYGNGAVAAGQNPAAVWAGGYRGVWHLNNNALDATGNGHTGTDFGSTDAVGFVGRARQFDGFNDRVMVPHAADLAFSQAQSYSLSTMAYVPALPNEWVGVVTKSRGTSPWYGLWIAGSNEWCYGAPSNLIGDAIATGWTHLALVQDGSAGTRTLYVNGALSASGGASAADGTGALWFGGAEDTTEYFSGRVDEVRIANVARSAAWIAAEHAAISDALLTYGPTEVFATLSATATLELFPETGELMFETIPPGLEVSVFGDSEATPFERHAIVNGSTAIGVASPQSLNNVTYAFVSWSDGGAASHGIVVTPGMQTFTATFAPVPAGNGDANCDGSVDFFDIDPFLLALFDLAEYSQLYPGCEPYADVDDSGTVDFFDIDPFLAVLFG